MIPQFIGQAVRYQGQTWLWDGVGWHIDDTANRIDLATVPAYLGQFVYKLPNSLPLPTFISLSDPDIYGATFVLSAVAPFEGVKVYKNGELMVMDDGSGTLGQYVVNRAANRIEFLPPGLVVQDVITVGILTPSDSLAPGRVNIEEIKDLDTDWVTNPGSPTTGMVNGVRRTFDLLVDVAGVGQQFAVIAKASDLAVFVGGVRQRPGIDYSVTGSELTMTVAPVAGVPFWALWYQPAGSGGGAGVSPPQPPQDTRLSLYGWRPGSGLQWEDARGIALTVANAAARTALRADVDILPGSLVLQADTQDLWRWSGAAWVRYLDAGTIAAPLGGRMQQLRSSTALQRPAADSGLPGQIWINLADRTLGYFDDGSDPVDLIGLDANGHVLGAFLNPALRTFGLPGTGSLVISDWNDAHLGGTAPVRAPAGSANRPPGTDLAYAGTYIAMGDANTGVLTAMSPDGNTVYVRPRSGGVWGSWIQVNSPGLDISSAMLRANNLSDVNSKPAGRNNLEVLFNPRTVYAGDLDALDETGLYPLGIGVTNGWVNDGTGAGGEATVGDAVLHIETGGALAYQLGFNVIPTGPAAKPLRLRFMVGPTTWTPWASILTADEVTAAIQAFGYARQMGDKDADAAGLVTEFFRATAGAPGGESWHTLMMSRALDAAGAQIAVRDGGTNRARLAWRHRGGAVWATWAEGQPILSGTTAQRPTTGLVPGLCYFDTTLQRPVYVNAAGDGWIDPTPDIPPGTVISDTAPLAPEPGQLWFKPSAPVGLYVWYDDGDSSQWVQAGGGALPPFASTAEARAGAITDKVMSPALVQARVGQQAIDAAGKLNLTFDEVPNEANEINLLLNGVAVSAGSVMSFDFSGAPTARAFSGRNLMAGAYSPPVGDDDNALFVLDSNTTNAQGYAGCVRLVRDARGGSWYVSGSLRRATSSMLVYSGVFNMRGEQNALLRLNSTIAFTGGSARVRWRI
jgi:hypothetical protein